MEETYRNLSADLLELSILKCKNQNNHVRFLKFLALIKSEYCIVDDADMAAAESMRSSKD